MSLIQAWLKDGANNIDSHDKFSIMCIPPVSLCSIPNFLIKLPPMKHLGYFLFEKSAGTVELNSW